MLVKFDNGIKVHSKVLTESHSFVCKLFVLSGSSSESRSLNGLAHFSEHMIFKGPKQFQNSNQFALYLEKNGIDINAKTSRDFICFELQVETNEAFKALKLLVDMLLNPSLKIDDFEKEKDVINEELEYLSDDPEQYCREEISNLMWGSKHPLGRSLIGNKKSIASMKITDIKDFLNSHFGTNNLLFSLAGNFNEDEILSYIDSIPAIYGAFSKREIHLINKADQKLRYLTRESQVVHTCVGYRLEDWKKENRWIYEVINLYIGDGISSRLFQTIREKHSLVYNIWSRPSLYIDGAEYVINYCTTLDKSKKACRQVMEELKGLQNITHEDLKVAKKRFRSNLLFRLENPNKYAYLVGKNFVITESVLDVNEVFENIDSLKLEDVQSLIYDIFEKQEHYIVEVGPSL